MISRRSVLCIIAWSTRPSSFGTRKVHHIDGHFGICGSLQRRRSRVRLRRVADRDPALRSTSEKLGVFIQNDVLDSGHDSSADAIAALNLVKWQVKETREQDVV